jgi:hypothetical protein
MRARARVRLASALLAALLGAALAIEVEITSADRLEIRTLTLPDGSEIELYVLEGSPVQLRIDDDLLEGERLEIDLTNRIVRVIGFGTFAGAQDTIQGEDLVIVLDDETFSGQDVLIVTDAIDVIGDDASRVPGQISIIAGQFSPCSRCSQEVEDYGFQAARLELFPGDRLVAYDANLLIRGRPFLFFPLLVVPLSPPDRQPRLAITSGTLVSRALVELSWPYVAGANALGSFTVRYYADVTPDTGNFFEENLLGGGIDTAYLGGSLDHRFFTPTGAGSFGVDYTPSFLDDSAQGGRLPDLLRASLAYATDDLTEPPSLELLLERDDARRNRVVEYTIRTADVAAGVRGEFASQGFTVLPDGDPDATPSYAGRSTPLRTANRLTLTREGETITLGPLTLDALELDLGLFEDVSNVTNRSAAGTPRIAAARLQERHALGVALALLPGLDLSASTDFRGSYYDTAERLIDWDTRAALDASFGDVGSFGLHYRRDINEGETPFRFDSIALRNRSDLGADLRLTPTPWATLTVGSGYVFEDSRDPDALGLEPLDSSLRLFDDRPWIGVSISNSYDLSEGDPGNLDASLDLRATGPVTASLNLNHTEDLLVTPDRLTGLPTDVSETTASARFGVASYLELDASIGITYDPPEPDPGEPEALWQPLEIGVTVGTIGQADLLPGLRLGYTRDLNTGEVSDLSYEFTARLGPAEASASQTFGVSSASLGSSRYELRWPGVAAIEARGMGLIQPDWLGLPFDGDDPQSWSISVRDAPIGGREVWRVTYQTTFDPALDGDGGLRNSALEPRLVLEETPLAGVRFAVDLAADIRLADDALDRSYLRSGNLGLAVDIYGVVGVQGELRFLGNYNPSLDELTSSRLSFDALTVTVHPIEELYLGATLNDVWDFSGNVASQSPWNLQPTLFLVWDRCCWALFAEWDSATGAITVALSAPGASEGLQQIFETALTLPGREALP